MPMTNYPRGIAQGISIRGVPILQTHPGEVFWVSNSTVLAPGQAAGSDNNPGTFQRPLATLAEAFDRVLANRGDIIVIKPGHAENVASATALSLDVAGVAIVGLGSGSLRPKFTCTTATTATINVTAANISITNCVISANFADIVSAFTLTTAPYFTLDNVEIAATATNMNFLHVIDTNAVTDDAKGLAVVNCSWLEPDAATLAFALVDGTNSNWVISDNFMVTGAATADIAAMFTIAAGKILTNLKCFNNNVQITGNSGTVAGLWLTTNQTTNSGIVAYNNLKHLDATTEIWQTSNAGFGLFENRATAITTGQGYLLPAIDS